MIHLINRWNNSLEKHGFSVFFNIYCEKRILLNMDRTNRQRRLAIIKQKILMAIVNGELLFFLL